MQDSELLEDAAAVEGCKILQRLYFQLGFYSTLKDSVDDIRKNYSTISSGSHFLELHHSCARDTLKKAFQFWLQMADAQAFFYEFRHNKKIFSEEQKNAVDTVIENIGLGFILFELWEN